MTQTLVRNASIFFLGILYVTSIPEIFERALPFNSQEGMAIMFSIGNLFLLFAAINLYLDLNEKDDLKWTYNFQSQHTLSKKQFYSINTFIEVIYYFSFFALIIAHLSTFIFSDDFLLKYQWLGHFNSAFLNIVLIILIPISVRFKRCLDLVYQRKKAFSNWKWTEQLVK